MNWSMVALPPPPICKKSKSSAGKRALWVPVSRREGAPALAGPRAEGIEEVAAEDVVIEDAEEDPAVTMEIAAAEIVELAPATTPSPAPSIPAAPAPTEAPTSSPAAAAAETRALASASLPEAPSVASVVRPVSESTWSVAALVDDDIVPRRRSGWWRYTLVSAGATALLCSLGFTLAGEPTPAVASARPVEATVIAYDPAAIADEAEPAVSAAAPKAAHDALLARRIALRGTRNLEAGRTRLAREAFEEALGRDPQCRPALAGLGRIHFAAGRHAKAADYLAPAVRIEPRDAELQGMLAQAYRAIGHHQSAARHERLAARHGG